LLPVSTSSPLPRGRQLGPFNNDDLGVVDEPVDHGRDGYRVAEDFGPGAERLVRGHNHRAALVVRRDEGKKSAAASGSMGM
jgi:hypothetical protein